MSDGINLDAYLKRINYAGSIAPVLSSLELLHRLHPAAIPFENLDPLMELPIRLQLSDLEQKLVVERRGGYCFEQNLLLKAALESMDFVVTPLAAGVLWQESDGYVPPHLSHMALLVDVGGVPYLADVGFGGAVATGPLRLRADVQQEIPSGRYRLTGGHPQWRLELMVKGGWRAMYEFTLQPRTLEEYVELNDQTVGDFRDDLLAARVDGARRYGLYNLRLNTYEGDETTTRMLASLDEIKEVLATTFGIALPQSERLDPALEKALRPGAPA